MNNVIIEDLVDGRVDPVLIIPVLGVNETVSYSGSFTPANRCGSTTDRIRVRGTDELGLTVTNFCEATCTLPACPPSIDVEKEIVCLLPGGCDAFTGSDTATGARGTNCPAFCYRITVRNTSAAGVELRNLSVIDTRISGDNLPLNLSGCNFPTTLAEAGSPGDSATCIISGIEHCVESVDRVIARAEGFLVGTATSVGTVEDRDDATALIRPIDVVCEKTIEVDGVNVGNRHTITDTDPHSIVWVVRVTNPGPPNSVLPICVSVSDPVLEALGVTIPAPFCLDVGQSGDFRLGPLTLTCPFDAIENTATVGAQVDVNRANVCAYDRQGRIIGDSTTCSALLDCEIVQPGICRVTGGGKQLLREGHVDPRTSARWVTHGGQVGSPIGVETPFTPDSECIRGQWQHTRHIGPGLDGNFHARDFDSIGCACLGCPESPGSGVVVGELCNPDDRVCGPEPRRAPANKICFSGVGNYALTNGRRAPRSVVFRVDIEDHSEPGGSPPGKHGSEDPPDRYRIRIWFITGDPYATANLDLRRAVACSAESVGLKDGVTDAERALGTAVFGVRAPNIDDGGDMDRGNHQIHPAHRKTCP